ncbi:hypothetical protein DCO58_09120 [Helicobacter saguini]|uniref:Thioredoxin reductase n=1 Tax=Helicobacter saguini TaxID=1548018 RepID=A0A347VXS1_9HELI|nr:hypothetical protein [Helicobacter saguini]MWV61520.1 hypothetical protein [Helicobacter saguini]MWV67810.1 hypothetical protein [Helicobacter saguini]MWV70722.1 hypothetical protein [Helicobacter saguini]MWV72625.1 hypothetical protein [Helicobacter saguini]TLD94567.1 hypothetical protein LS64_005220 [Helicobacter saguini]
MRIVKDIFGNDIHLDSEGNIIFKDYVYDIKTMFRDEIKKLPVEDKKLLKENAYISTRLLNETNDIIRNSPYAHYQPIYLDPTQTTGQSSTFNTFKSWQDLYLKDPIKKAIAPWTKKEKAYFESLKTRMQRYKYLVIRSGLRSSVIDIPFDAIGAVDEDGNIINRDYEDLYRIVDKKKNTMRSYLHGQEWGIAAGILGRAEYFARDNCGFTSRYIQEAILGLQINPWELTKGNNIMIFGKNIIGETELGFKYNPLKKQQVKALVNKIKPDKFGMLPYIDEIIGADWILDFSKYDAYNDILPEIDDYIYEGKLLDPRDSKATQETRKEFMKISNFLIQRRRETAALDLPDIPTLEDPQLEYDILVLYANVLAVTPPQGYPNAPLYYTPESLEELYKSGKLDKKLDPRIPAIYRESFPQYLRDEIEAYAKKHKIK